MNYDTILAKAALERKHGCPVWETKTGELIPVIHMELSHMHNAWNLMVRNGMAASTELHRVACIGALAMLREEFLRRGEDFPATDLPRVMQAGNRAGLLEHLRLMETRADGQDDEYDFLDNVIDHYEAKEAGIPFASPESVNTDYYALRNNWLSDKIKATATGLHKIVRAATTRTDTDKYDSQNSLDWKE